MTNHDKHFAAKAEVINSNGFTYQEIGKKHCGFDWQSEEMEGEGIHFPKFEELKKAVELYAIVTTIKFMSCFNGNNSWSFRVARSNFDESFVARSYSRADFGTTNAIRPLYTV